MNYKMIGRFMGQILAIEALFMIPALLISLFCRETASIFAFLLTLAVILVLSGTLLLLCRGAAFTMRAREGLVCVGLSWIVLSLVGCLPFYFSREIPLYIDALFEIVSGFTTTGASIMPNVEIMSKGTMYWRSFSHWLGGMGVLVFLLAVSPNSKGGTGYTVHLLKAESPGPDVSKLVPTMKKTALILYLIYIAMTVINILFLVAGNMSLFESVCTAFGTAGTGGFGIKNDSMAGYSPYLQNVTTVFMFLFGVNFSCYYLLLMGQIKSFFKDEELRVYFGIVVVFILLIVWDLRGVYGTLEETLRHASFQVSSIITTTGFSTTDFDLWPSFSKVLLLGLMFIGACAGSTGGGMKVIRVMLLFKSLRRNIRQVLNPQKVQAIRSNGQVVNERILSNCNVYLTAYVLIVLLSIALVSLDEFSITTNISAVVACFNNIGPGLDAVGPICNYGIYSPFSKLVLILDMLAGRLEIFPILVLFSRNTWNYR